MSGPSGRPFRVIVDGFGKFRDKAAALIRIETVPEEAVGMKRFFRKDQKKIGLPPGTVEYAGEKKMAAVELSVTDWDLERCEEKRLTTVEECFPYRDTSRAAWININGLHDTGLLQSLGAHFNLHPLVLEDIVNTHQRPKVEDHGDYLFIVLKMLYYEKADNIIVSEQVSLIVGRNFLLSFQEKKGDVFDPVRQRFQSPNTRLRKSGPDYLAYSLIDAVVDHYYVILENFGEQIESLEDDLLESPEPELLEVIHQVKREMIFLRKSIWPLRDVTLHLEHSESELIQESISIYFRDVYDHVVQIMDAIESFRDIASSMQDLYLSGVSNRMNEVMKILTIICTIFVPLTFLAGIYGMNFQFMPELKWRWGYPLVWGVIIGLGLWMLRYFRNKRWL
jgi:magnesium transporter